MMKCVWVVQKAVSDGLECDVIVTENKTVGRCYFFFQAEDGIRDAQESRGLGDVYKRQVCNQVVDVIHKGLQCMTCLAQAMSEVFDRVNAEPVSYTHLTLPTIYSV